MSRPYLTRHARRRRSAKIVVGVAAAITIVIAAIFAAAGFFDTDPFHVFAAEGRRSPIGAVYFSGDMGLRFGTGSMMSATLAKHGIPVVGVNSSTLFATRQTRADVDRIVADAVRQGLAHTGSRRLVLIGQSYGADILQTGLEALPGDLRDRIAAVILIVPGETVFFRADPSGLVYRGTPDSLGVATARSISWVPLTCIHGSSESDSLCPALHLPNLRTIAMPGGHFLHHDSETLIANVLAAIGRAVPGAIATSPKDGK